MTTLARRRRSSSPAEPARSAPPSSTSCSTPAPRSIDVLDNLVRGPAGQPRRRRSPAAGSTLVEGDIRDRDLVARPDRGQGPRLPPGRHPDHPVRRGAPAGARGAGRRHVQRRRGGGRSIGSTSSSRPLSASVYGLAEAVSDHRSGTTTTTTTRSTAPPSPSTRAWPAASGRCTGSTTSLLRYFNVYGPRMDVHGLYTEVLVRWMERIADGSRR